MISTDIETTVNAAWEAREEITPNTVGDQRKAVEVSLELLDSGQLRVAEKTNEGWTVNQWVKKAVLLSFRLNDMTTIENGPGHGFWWDKIPSKFSGWTNNDFETAGFRAVPNCVVRRSAFIAPGVVSLR